MSPPCYSPVRRRRATTVIRLLGKGYCPIFLFFLSVVSIVGCEGGIDGGVFSQESESVVFDDAFLKKNHGKTIRLFLDENDVEDEFFWMSDDPPGSVRSVIVKVADQSGVKYIELMFDRSKIANPFSMDRDWDENDVLGQEIIHIRIVP